MRISDWSSDVCSSDLNGQNLASESPRLALVFGHVAVEQRHEGAGKGTFGKQAAEQIGQLKRELPSIGNTARAQHAGQHDVAGKAKIGRASCQERVCQDV